MSIRTAKGFVVRLVSAALICAGFTQFAFAGTISSQYLVDAQARETNIARIEVLLASERVAEQFTALGVDVDVVKDRIQALSDAELVTLQNHIDEQVAGGDALGLVGAVFVVLMILELVGVTDIFKSF
jgi:hypothetical protein